MNIQSLLSQRTGNMQANALREILKVTTQHGIVSLAGGLPAPESFPIDVIRQLSNDVLDEFGPSSLQYDKTEGFEPLRVALYDYLPKQGLVNVTPQTLGVFSGSQSILDILGKVLITPGDKIAIEAPSYLGAISAFNAYEPQYVSIQTDDDGVIPESLEEVLKHNTVKFVYLMPTFQNPTGRTLPLARRHQIAEIIKRYDVLVLEDDPYNALRYSGQPQPPLQQFAPDNVIYSSTFSKILSPGLRLGFSVAPPLLARWLIIAKQATDLHTQTFGQAIAALYLSGGYLTEQLPKIIGIYRPRRDAMVEALGKYMPTGFRWNNPEGGMFLWMTGPAGMDAEILYNECIKRGVAFVPGKYCYYEKGAGLETMRLNFTTNSEEIITKSVKTIGEAAEELLVKA
jgi:2-aminoadipate transaminase